MEILLEKSHLPDLVIVRPALFKDDI